MKLQVKVDDLLKKVEGLIIKDIAARKEHNRKVGVINSKVDEYIDGKKQQREAEKDNAKEILSNYTDEQLKSLFLEKCSVEYKSVFSLSAYKETVRPIDDSVTLDGVEFEAFIVHTKCDNIRMINITRYKRDYHHNLVEEDCWLKIVPANLTSIPEVITPTEMSESPDKELTILKDKLIQAKQHGVGECIIEDEDLAVMDKYGKLNQYEVSKEYTNRDWARWDFYSFAKYDIVHWSEIVSVEDL